MDSLIQKELNGFVDLTGTLLFNQIQFELSGFILF